MTPLEIGFVVLLCMAAEAFFSGMETGVVSIRRVQLEHLVRRRDREAEILKGFLDDSDRLFGTTLVGTNLCIVAVSVLSASVAGRVPGIWGEVASILVNTVMLLIFSEYIPKAWFSAKPLQRCRTFAPGLRFAEVLLRPIAVGVVAITRLFVRGRGLKSFARAGALVSKEDLKLIVREVEKDGMISSRDRRMIQNVLELPSKTVGQIMVPREKMVTIMSDTEVAEFLEIARKSRFTRFPVFDRENNRFAGVVNLFFVVSEDPQKIGKTVAGFIRKPLLVPETMPLDDLVPLMRRARQPMCMVTNAQSEVTGLVTTEDVVRAIMGAA